MRVSTSSRNGSSPRVWGILIVGVLVLLRERFIPTCVGNTTTLHPRRHSASVHPHVCGEYTPNNPFGWRIAGSSPRVWGILQVFHLPIDKFRFIPTCVGNTCYSPRCRSSHPVHPHVCGEYCRVLRISSMRRFIPTCVGNTQRAAGRQAADCGSSPRVWGILGINLSPCQTAPVHPHVCGEYPSESGIVQYPVRFIPTCVGNTSTNVAHCGKWRFIPTCVGNTRRVSSAEHADQVHPHVCGEYARTRHSGRLCVRFIPTCVGNTILT